MSRVDAFDRALDGEPGPESTPASIRGLLDMATEVAEALAAVRLSRADQERLYARSLDLLEQALRHHRRSWRRALAPRRAPVLVGAAAVFTLGAAVGWAVLRGRRAGAPAVA